MRGLGITTPTGPARTRQRPARARDAEFGGKDTIVGDECDGCEFEMRDGLPVPTHRDGTPESFTILATCPARWDAAPHHHPAVSNSASFLRASEPFLPE